jgi:hypothetical protein
MTSASCCLCGGIHRVNWVAVVKAQELQQIQKLKFKRNVSITLIFKGATNERSPWSSL